MWLLQPLATFWSIPPLLLLGLFVLYIVMLAVYRLYLSPLSKFPGPKIAALTWWYQFYHDVVRRGQYIWVVQSMHAKYGPIVRINPCELHICESEFYDTLYVFGGISRKRDKWAWDTIGAAGVTDSSLSTTKHDLHRMRRSAVAPFFSMQNVRKLQPVIQAKVDILIRRLIGFRASGDVVNVAHAFSALTNDVIMEYCFARSANRLEASDFDPSYKNASHGGVRLAQIAKHLRFLSWISKVMLILPESILGRLGPSFHMFLVERKRLFGQIEALKYESSTTGPDSTHMTVFRELLNSNLPPEEKSPKRLAAEAQVLVSAGSETTARALTFACYSLLRSPAALSRLKQELESALPGSDFADSRTSLEQVQKLPYLTAVIKESLRLSYGVVGRLQRVWPNEEIRFHDWTIPRGTPVSMTSYDVHHDERIFKDSYRFDPQRWIDDNNNPGLDRFLVSFGKGSRQCIGMNLAMAEMYLTLSRLFRWLGSEQARGVDDIGKLVLFDTDDSEVKMVGEVLVPFMKKDAKGVRVVIST